MKNFTKHLQNTNALHSLWERGETIIVGVSGGRDSMCLVHALLRIASKEGLQIIAAHVNYGLRGEASDRDQAIVEKFCADNAIVCETLIVGPEERGKSEACWRTTRRSFFARVATNHQAHSIALGHHMDDQAETLLFNLVRGSGLQGLSNMRFVSEQILDCSLSPSREKDRLIRPLLGVSRDDITKYCADYCVVYGEDETNHLRDFTRNRIRHELIPYLKKNYNHEITETLSRSATIIGDDYAFLSESCPLKFERKGNTVAFSRNDLICLPVSAQRHFLRFAISSLLGDGGYKSFGLVEEFRKTILSKKNKDKTVTTRDLIFHVKNATVEITLVS